MNVVARYLERHRTRLGLDDLGVPPAPSCLVLTPRFALSRHVVVLVLRGQEPVLVAKLPRVAGDGAGLAREAANLPIALRTAAGTDVTVPRLVAFDERPAHPLLLETALVGRPLSPLALGRHAGAVPAVATWLQRVAARTARRDDESCHDDLVRAPLERLLGRRDREDEIRRLAEATFALTAPLDGAPLPTVLEHGDLAHPNLVALAGGGVGVLDWETGTARGLPAHDLVFFLAYVADAAARRGRRPGADDPAGAFSARDGWAWPAIARYCDALGIARELLVPLVVACAARAVATLPDREGGGQDTAGDAWLTGGRPFRLWRHLVTQASEPQFAMDGAQAA